MSVNGNTIESLLEMCDLKAQMKDGWVRASIKVDLERARHRIIESKARGCIPIDVRQTSDVGGSQKVWLSFYLPPSSFLS